MYFSALEPEITKEFIFSKINQESIMQFYTGIDVTSKKLHLSPFRNDHKVTCALYKSKSNILYLHDFATNEHINCFQVVMKKYGVNYYEALQIIARDFRLIGGSNSNLKEAPKDEENPVQEPPENNQVDESKIEENYSQFKKWLYIVLAILLLSVFGLYLYRNHSSQVEETDNSDVENVIEMAEAEMPEPPKSVKLDYEMFLYIFKTLSSGPNKFEFHKPPQALIDKYGLECHELIEQYSRSYALGRNIKNEGYNLAATGKNAWGFVLYRGEEGDVLALEILDPDDYKDFINQANEYGVARVKMYSDYEDEEFVGNKVFAAIRVPKGSIVDITSEDELNTYDVIGPLYIEDNSNRIGLHTEVEHWDFNRDPRFN